MVRAAILGGGASGLFAACALVGAGVKVSVYEKQNRVGRKLLSTGNGRCNLSNLNAAPGHYRGDPRYVVAALRALPPKAAMERFAELGLMCVSDEEGRVYPAGNQAAGVLDALRLYAAEHDCEIVTDFEVTRLARKGRLYRISAADGRRAEAECVIVACGGLAAPKLGGCGDGYRLLEALGHEITPRLPAIAAIRTDPAALRGLKGIRMHGVIELLSGGEKLRREVGEILFGEGAVSGIAAMQLARSLNLALREGRRCILRMNFLPNGAALGQDAPELVEELARRLPERMLEDLLTGLVPKRLGQALVRAAGVGPLTRRAASLTGEECRNIYAALTGWTLPALGTLGFEQAQVTCGGAALTGFDPNTLESLRAPNLFAVGEVLDVDGDCGGYNLHWAWASAELAARAILAKRG